MEMSVAPAGILLRRNASATPAPQDTEGQIASVLLAQLVLINPIMAKHFAAYAARGRLVEMLRLRAQNARRESKHFPLTEPLPVWTVLLGGTATMEQHSAPLVASTNSPVLGHQAAVTVLRGGTAAGARHPAQIARKVRAARVGRVVFLVQAVERLSAGVRVSFAQLGGIRWGGQARALPVQTGHISLLLDQAAARSVLRGLSPVLKLAMPPAATVPGERIVLLERQRAMTSLITSRPVPSMNMMVQDPS